MKKRMKGFTLIELIAVLVIMAIIALIVTPLVMSIIRKARVSADRRSVDAYGRSIELAIAGYLLDNGKFPTEVSQLTIEYSENKVECETTQINTDSSVYLAGCTVAGRSVENYTYGSDKSPTYTAYTIGNQVTYNNINYYVIKDSGAKESTVTLLKAEPLSVEEVNTYGGVGTANNHVNMYNASSSDSYYQKAYDRNGYGGMAYYTSADCGYGQDSNHTETGCTTDYAQSEVKYVVDAWKTAKAPAALDARLITLEDLKSLGYSDDSCIQSGYCWTSAEAPSWLHINSWWYWTSSPVESSSSNVWDVDGWGLRNNHVFDCSTDGVVRPVITILKSEL